jgi:hypothetical protein
MDGPPGTEAVEVGGRSGETGADQVGIGAGRSPAGGGLLGRRGSLGRGGRPVEEPGGDGIEDRPPAGREVENGRSGGAAGGMETGRGHRRASRDAAGSHHASRCTGRFASQSSTAMSLCRPEIGRGAVDRPVQGGKHGGQVDEARLGQHRSGQPCAQCGGVGPQAVVDAGERRLRTAGQDPVVDEAGEGGAGQSLEAARLAPLPRRDGEADVDDPGVEERSVHRQPPPGPAQCVEVRVLGARGLQGETLAQSARARCEVGALRAGADESGQSGAAARGEPAGGTQLSAPAGRVRGVRKHPRSRTVEDGGGES